MTTAAPFDAIAARYDELWTNTGAGRLQRDAVWRHIDPLFRKGQRVLDLGCGTGEDALHLMGAGVEVQAFDASPEMVRVARQRGVAAHCLTIENLARSESQPAGETACPTFENMVFDLVAQAVSPAIPDPIAYPPGVFDGALSNFGALNCVREIATFREPLAHLIRLGGHLALCMIGRFCLRETLHYLRRGRFRKAVRRWNGESTSASLGLRVYYPTVRQIERALVPDFTLVRTVGIGLCVPPSYLAAAEWHAVIDRRLADHRFFRALTDHRLLIFHRT